MHVRVGRKQKHSVTGRMIDVTLRAVSSYLVLGSELGILLGSIYLHISLYAICTSWLAYTGTAFIFANVEAVFRMDRTEDPLSTGSECFRAMDIVISSIQ